MAKEQSGDWIGAVADLDASRSIAESLPINVMSWGSWETIGYAYEHVGRLDDARIAYGKAVHKVDTGFSSGWDLPRWYVRYGELCWRVGDLQTAELEFNEAVKRFYYVNVGGDFRFLEGKLHGQQLRQAALTAAIVAQPLGNELGQDMSAFRETVFAIDPKSVFADLVRADMWRYKNLVTWANLLAVAESDAKGRVRTAIHKMREGMPECNGGGILDPLPGEPPKPEFIITAETMLKQEAETRAYYRKRAEDQKKKAGG